MSGLLMVPWPEIPRSNLFCALGALGSGGRSLSQPANARPMPASKIKRKKAFMGDVIACGEQK